MKNFFPKFLLGMLLGVMTANMIANLLGPAYASIDPQAPFDLIQYMRDNRYRVIMLQVKGPGMRGASPELKRFALAAFDRRMDDLYSALNLYKFQPRKLPRNFNAYGEIILELPPLDNAGDPLSQARLTVKIPTKKIKQIISGSALSPGNEAVNLIITELWPLGDDPPKLKK